MGRDASDRLSEALAVPHPSSPIAEMTKEGGSMGDKGDGTARDSDLSAMECSGNCWRTSNALPVASPKQMKQSINVKNATESIM